MQQNIDNPENGLSLVEELHSELKLHDIFLHTVASSYERMVYLSADDGHVVVILSFRKTTSR